MKEIALKNILEFNRRSERSRATLIRNSQKPKVKKAESGGNYWVRSLSAITNACKQSDNQTITDKINEITLLIEKDLIDRTKNMYSRNIAILKAYEDFDFDKIKPNSELVFLPGLRSNSIINTQGLLIQLIPSLVFSFECEGKTHVGSILFVAQLGGYSRQELELVSEALVRYLRFNYSSKYEVDRDYCIVVDLISQEQIKHSEINRVSTPKKLNETIKQILKIIR